MAYKQAKELVDAEIENILEGNAVVEKNLKLAELVQNSTQDNVDLSSLETDLSNYGIDLINWAQNDPRVLQFQLTGRKLQAAISTASQREVIEGRYANLLRGLEDYLQ